MIDNRIGPQTKNNAYAALRESHQRFGELVLAGRLTSSTNQPDAQVQANVKRGNRRFSTSTVCSDSML